MGVPISARVQERYEAQAKELAGEYVKELENGPVWFELKVVGFSYYVGGNWRVLIDVIGLLDDIYLEVFRDADERIYRISTYQKTESVEIGQKAWDNREQSEAKKA